MNPDRGITGRLAPTPSGYLHLGNARSFLLAWLWARRDGGRVIMRVEDIDLGRCKPHLRHEMLRDLDWLGLDWDAGPHAGDPPGEFDQRTRFAVYRGYLDALAGAGLAYPCVCSRKDVEEASSAPHGNEGAVYPGTCRDRWDSFEHARREGGREPAWRFKWDSSPVTFTDEVRGETTVDPSRLGDFVLWRRDGAPSYQLAVTVDDALQGVTQVLRGRDLLNSTARQLALYRALGLAPPAQWAHVSFIQDAKGRRMAKRDGDLALIHLRESGVSPARVIGFVARAAGLTDRPGPLKPRELVDGFDPRRLAREDFLVTEDHVAWLYA